MNLPNRSNRLLIVKVGAIGDVIMTTPGLAALRKREPDIKIYYLVGKKSASVLSSNQNIDEIIDIPEDYFTKKKILELFKTLLKLHRFKFSRIYILHRDISYYLLFHFLFIPIYGFRKRYISVLPIFSKDNFMEGVHHIKNHIYALGNGNEVSSQLDFKVANYTKLPKVLSNIISSEKKIIVINPGGGINHAERVTVRRWGVEKFAKLILRIDREYKNQFCFAFSGIGEECFLAESIIEIVKNGGLADQLYNITGKSTIVELRLFLEKVSCFITGDTGGMHIASSANVPILSIFGPTNPLETAPLNPNSVYVESALSCAPCCSGKFRGCSNVICMDNISVDRVFEIFKKIMEANEGSYNT